MGALSLILLVAGGLLAGLVVVAVLVAALEWLRDLELHEAARRDRAVYAATSPLPLAPSAAFGSGAPTLPLARPLGGPPAAEAGPPRRDANWIETRPMVLCPTPIDDDAHRQQRKTVSGRSGEDRLERQREGERQREREGEREREREPDLLLD